MTWLVEPGFWSNQPVQIALVVGGVVAVVSAVAGVFTVLRGQSFAGHSLGDVDTAGGSGAVLIGVNPLWGFVGIGLAAAGAMELLGVRRARGRDVATGVVLGASLGLAALLLYLDSTWHSTTGATSAVLFGSVFELTWSVVPAVVLFGALVLVLIGLLFRPLLLSSVSDEMASARGIPVRTLGLVFLLTMAIAVSLSALAVGAILSTALLVGPAAAALRVTRRPLTAVAVAVGLGLFAMWLGILLSYDSYYWPPAQHGWPVSFLVVALVFVLYLVAGAVSRVVRRAEGSACSPG